MLDRAGVRPVGRARRAVTVLAMCTVLLRVDPLGSWPVVRITDGVARIVNIAHTAFYMLAAYCFYMLLVKTGLGFVLAGLISVGAVTLLSVICYRLVIEPVREHEAAVLIATIALALIFQELMLFSFGGNYNDKLYIGALIGFQSLRYETERRYEETVLYDQPMGADTSVLMNFVQNEKTITSGLGFNMKLGAIYRIADNFRIGGAVHTPTFYSLSEEYTLDIHASFSDFTPTPVPTESQAVSNFDYRMHTPFRFIGSLGWIVGGKAAINLDYEYVDYNNIKLKESKQYEYASGTFANDNKEISKVYQSTHNFRLGTEYRLDPFAIRAGVRYDGNPYTSKVDAEDSKLTYSVGAGFREQNFFMDIAYMFSKAEVLNYPYASVEVPAKITNKVNYITITAGFRFD